MQAIASLSDASSVETRVTGTYLEEGAVCEACFGLHIGNIGRKSQSAVLYVRMQHSA